MFFLNFRYITRESSVCNSFDIRDSSWRNGFSSIDDWLKVTIINLWPTVGDNLLSHEVPASLLLNPDKSFQSFGRLAQEQYDFQIEKGGKEYYFFPQVSKLFESEKVSTIWKDVNM